jgi:hypothetical protein
MKDALICLFPFWVIIIGCILESLWRRYSSGQKRWESIMKPCPRCGHKAIIVWYNGENDPQFYQPECGAYARRECEHPSYRWGEIYPEKYFDDQPPMTDEQKKCKYLAGYCNDEKHSIKVPEFRTPRAAAKWWNRNYKRAKKEQ